MKRGDTIYLRRPQRLIRATLVALYDYPAVRVKVRGQEKIVGKGEIVKAAKVEADRADRLAARHEKQKQATIAQHAELISRWKPGMTSTQWRDAYGWSIGEWSAIRRLKRLGVIS